MFSHLGYVGGVLHYDLANLNEVGTTYSTPVFVYSKKKIIENYNEYKNAFEASGFPNFQISYAMKANDNFTILEILKNLGSGIDAVSIGEVKKALLVGFDARKIVFSGVGKTREELEFAIENGVGQINLESYEEFLMVCDIVKISNKKANISVRVNPNIDAHTNEKITTGKKENKFGVSVAVAEKIIAEICSNEFLKEKIAFKGLSAHIGSQITDLYAFEKLFIFLEEIYKKYNHQFSTIDFGGGIGIKYKEDDEVIKIEDYVALIKKYFGDYKGKIIIEPGRSIIGNAGIFLSKVVRVKQTEEYNFIVLDGGMNNLIRPAIYGAYHHSMVVKKTDGEAKKYSIVGPICETSDVFVKDAFFNEIEEDNFFVFLCAGAYGRSMASNYNLHDLAGEILIDENGKVVEIRKPITFEDLIKFEKFN